MVSSNDVFLRSCMIMSGKGVELEALGTQLAVELFACAEALLRNAHFLEEMLIEAAEASGATIVDSVFHTFNPNGTSGVLIIAESHIAIHTWPEYRYAAVDIFTCGTSIEPDDIADHIKRRLRAGQARIQRLRRGMLDGDSLRITAAAPT